MMLTRRRRKLTVMFIANAEWCSRCSLWVSEPEYEDMPHQNDVGKSREGATVATAFTGMRSRTIIT